MLRPRSSAVKNQARVHPFIVFPRHRDLEAWRMSETTTRQSIAFPGLPQSDGGSKQQQQRHHHQLPCQLRSGLSGGESVSCRRVSACLRHHLACAVLPPSRLCIGPALQQMGGTHVRPLPGCTTQLLEFFRCRVFRSGVRKAPTVAGFADLTGLPELGSQLRYAGRILPPPLQCVRRQLQRQRVSGFPQDTAEG